MVLVLPPMAGAPSATRGEWAARAAAGGAARRGDHDQRPGASPAALRAGG